ncbi:MAG: glycosyltransferase [Chitinivibrionales bacterium]|nr:glycosyltransferase [Chitinivibrionales bacterium]MBD3394909.1 glycosyltransferase [Chitinivibrionales bacterium]
MYRSLLGANAWTAALFWFCAAFGMLAAVSTVFAVLYHRLIYARFRRPRYDPSFRPRCSIILPCKGADASLESNLEAFLALEYPSYEILFAVESENDPAAAVIRRVIDLAPDKCALVVAGHATACAQKNHNQLAALEKTHDPEVYVFADADIRPSAGWLSELVLPLSNPKNVAATGFRWLYSSKGRVGEHVHAFQNNITYVAFSAASAVSNLAIVWGGSMAIRKSDFEELGVAGRWAETVVDDISLSQIIMRSGKQTVLVPPCVLHTDDAIETFMQGVRWFERQTMFLKYYHTKTWSLLAMPVLSLVLLCLCWLPAALLIAAASPASFLGLGGASPLLVIAGATIAVLLFPLIGPNPTYGMFLLCTPLSVFSTVLATVRTIFTNTVTWSNIRYRLRFGGRVASVERLPA